MSYYVIVLTNAKLKVVVSIFGIGFQRHQGLTIKRNPSDVIVYHDVIKVLLRHRPLVSAYQC